MGLLDEYGIDVETEVPDAPSYDIVDDIYEFELANVFIQHGTSKDPESNSIVFDFLLGDDGKKIGDWYRLPVDPAHPTDAELTKLSYYKQRLASLGIPKSEMNSVTNDELIGLRGTLQVFTKNGFQNIKNVRVYEADEASEPAEEPVAKAAPAVRKPPAAKAAAAPTAVKNPFAAK